MKFFGALVLMVTLSTASGLRCYVCAGVKDKSSCTETITCPSGFDRCSSVMVEGLIGKTCLPNSQCGVNNIECCKSDLCNSAISTGSSVFILLVSSAIMTVFL